QSLVNNGYPRPDSYDVVYIYDVPRAHSNASITVRRADPPFLRRAVDVDIPGERVRILRLESAQPENARHDRIPARRIREDNFTRAPPIFEDRARWRIIANLFRDLQLAQWRVSAASPITETELGGRDR